MAPHERWNSLLEIVARDGNLEVEQAARELGVSTATIRRDLDHLAQQQMLTRTRGGAMANSVSYDLPLRYKSARRATEKERIARAAAALIPPGAIVGLNGGTTTNELIVRRHVKIVVTGGVARPQSYELIGPLATRLLGELTLDQLCLGVDAVSVSHGATAYNEGEASINQLMVTRAREVIVVADSSKLGRHAFARICPIDRVDVLVTDSAAAESATAPFTDAGVRVIRA
jgi:DeoR family transcriptional regulator, aga operon transcriptional repressor